ncbi:hypothetical protein KIW84_044839 [Lathyrus oleraceus]|uniref:Retrovirus-related Pol polyprotein from transposon TNT 1-94-like beta-barrel domain-containing protein n=1 Tax=Pisum sativum TaxID=3888 RepID=A0A9D4XJH0_PEA|nr:hypothetical protein KIW84_044839 [Pisum sativum]
MSGTKEWFVTLDEKFRRSVKLGNGDKLEVVGKGSVRLVTEQKVLVVQDVFYVPGLTTNLLSVGEMQEKGLTFLIKNNKGWDSEPESSSSSTTLIWEGCIDEVCDSDADDSKEESNHNPTNEAEDHLVQNEPNVTATDLEPRQRRLPLYLEDYDLSFSQTDLWVMLASAEDPLIFEDAVKEEKWRIV